MAVCLVAGCISTARALADEELPVYGQRRFGPYVEPEPRNCAPSLAQAVGSGLLPPWGWGWYGYWGYPGWGWNRWYGGSSGWNGYGGPWGPAGTPFPYTYGYNGHFWYPNGPTWPYGSLNPLLGPSQFGPLPPLNYSFVPVLNPWFATTLYGGSWEQPGLYYW